MGGGRLPEPVARARPDMEIFEGFGTMLMNNLGEILMAVGILLVVAAIVIPMVRDNEADATDFFD